MTPESLDKIIITDLLARGHIGVPAEERERPQDILVNLILYVDTRKAAQTDSVTDSVDYSQTASMVLNLVQDNHSHTLETLAGSIATLCLSLKGVEGVRVRIEKPNRVRFTRLVGVEIERMK